MSMCKVCQLDIDYNMQETQTLQFINLVFSFRQSWLFQHKFLVVMIFYGLMLLLIGLYNSRYGLSFRKYLRGV